MALPFVVIVAGCQNPPGTFSPTKHLSCHQLISDVIKNSEQEAAKDPRNWPLASIDEVKTAPLGLEYECSGVARLSSGERVKVRYGYTDTHGQQAAIYTFDIE